MNFDRFACDMGVKVRAAKGKKDAEGCQTLWSCTAELLLIVQELSTCSGKDRLSRYSAPSALGTCLSQWATN